MLVVRAVAGGFAVFRIIGKMTFRIGLGQGHPRRDAEAVCRDMMSEEKIAA